MRFLREISSGSSPSKYLSIQPSSCSTASSIRSALIDFALLNNSSLMSRITHDAPKSSDSQTHSFIETKSTRPKNSFSAPIGRFMGIGVAPVLSFTISTHLKKSAPILSILLTNTILGTLYLSACLQTVSVCGSIPAFASSTTTAPSRTANDLSTSIVKST